MALVTIAGATTTTMTGVGDLALFSLDDIRLDTPADGAVLAVAPFGVAGPYGPLAATSAVRAGSAVATGDFDGDEIPDLVSGDPGYNGGNGAIEVFMGVAPDDLRSPTTAIQSLSDGLTGSSVAVGDFNDDGFDDLAVGAPNFTAPGFPNSGKVLVYAGSPQGLNISSGPLEIESSISGARCGTSLAADGDFTGDGFPDLGIGCPGNSTIPAFGGVVRVYPGGPSGVIPVLTEARTLAQVGTLLGSSVAFCPDFNGDGLDDLAAGAPGVLTPGVGNTGGVFIDFGAASGSAGGILLYLAASIALGTSVVGLGDWDDDGFSEIASGYSGSIPGSGGTGGVVQFLGSASGSPKMTIARSGTQPSTAGRALGAVDLDLDGHKDLIVGDPTGSLGGGPPSGLARFYLAADGRIDFSAEHVLPPLPGALEVGSAITGWSANDTYPPRLYLGSPGTPGGGGVLRYEWEHVPVGTLVSPIVDALGAGAVWESMELDALVPDETSVTLALRTGEEQFNGIAWGPWQTVPNLTTTWPDPTVRGRFGQVQVTLQSLQGGVSPIVRGLSLSHRSNTHAAPTITLPLNGALVSATTLQMQWQDDDAEGDRSDAVRVEIATDDSFSEPIDTHEFTEKDVLDDHLLEITTPPQGTVWLRLSTADSFGMISPWSQPIAITIDTVAPVAVAPLLEERGNASPLEVLWDAVDPVPGSGIATFDVDVSTQAGGPWLAWLVQTPARSAVWSNSSGGSTLQFRVRATDLAGNTGGWAHTSVSGMMHLRLDTPSPVALLGERVTITVNLTPMLPGQPVGVELSVLPPEAGVISPSGVLLVPGQEIAVQLSLQSEGPLQVIARGEGGTIAFKGLTVVGPELSVDRSQLHLPVDGAGKVQVTFHSGLDAPAQGQLTVRSADSGGAALAVSPPSSEISDDTPMELVIDAPPDLPPGSYQVQLRLSVHGHLLPAQLRASIVVLIDPLTLSLQLDRDRVTLPPGGETVIRVQVSAEEGAMPLEVRLEVTQDFPTQAATLATEVLVSPTVGGNGSIRLRAPLGIDAVAGTLLVIGRLGDQEIRHSLVAQISAPLAVSDVSLDSHVLRGEGQVTVRWHVRNSATFEVAAVALQIFVDGQLATNSTMLIGASGLTRGAAVVPLGAAALRAGTHIVTVTLVTDPRFELDVAARSDTYRIEPPVPVIVGLPPWTVLLAVALAAAAGLGGYHPWRTRIGIGVVEEVLVVLDDGRLVFDDRIRSEQAATEVDHELVAGMLTAIRDFVHTGLQGHQGGGDLQSIGYGDRTIVLDHQPPVVVAVVVRGRVPPELEDHLSRVTARLLRRHGDMLRKWDGDRAKLETTLRTSAGLKEAFDDLL